MPKLKDLDFLILYKNDQNIQKTSEIENVLWMKKLKHRLIKLAFVQYLSCDKVDFRETLRELSKLENRDKEKQIFKSGKFSKTSNIQIWKIQQNLFAFSKIHKKLVSSIMYFRTLPVNKQHFASNT